MAYWKIVFFANDLKLSSTLYGQSVIQHRLALNSQQLGGDLGFLLLFPSTLECWHYRHATAFWLVYMVLGMEPQVFVCARQACYQVSYILSPPK